MNANNTQLLKKYAKEDDQKAFDQLVANLINIAYSASLACLGREDLARDACQLTFLELSKKAGHLSDSVQLGGWVHTTAYNMARKIQRSDIRRQKREQHYVNDMNKSQHKEPDWTTLLPEIHEAMGQLKSKERDAIILRFFQNKSLADVGAAMNVSADAARMRVNRALEQLNVQLTRKGIASTATALAAALPAHALTVAPSGLALSISTSILAGAGTAVAGTSTLVGATLIIMKTKSVIISAAVAATVVTGTGIYRATHNEGKEGASYRSEEQVPLAEKEVLKTLPKRAAVKRSSAPIEPDASYQDEDAADSNRLGIEAEYLEQAADLVGLMKAKSAELDSELMMEMQNESLTKMAMGELPNPSEQLTLRLGLGAEVAETFKEVLGRHQEEEAERVRLQIKSIHDVAEGWLEEYKEEFTDYMALNIKYEKEGRLTEAQEEFVKQFQEDTITEMKNEDELDNHSLELEEWYESEAVVNALKAELSAEQQEALMITIEERKSRASEGEAYTRSYELANKLGLGEEDRSALYEFLYNHPGATDEDIAEELSPELRPLMPKDDGLFRIKPITGM